MSADNYYGIWLGDDGVYRVYMYWASEPEPEEEDTTRRVFFKSLYQSKVIAFAQDDQMVEYGYRFMDIEEGGKNEDT